MPKYRSKFEQSFHKVFPKLEYETYKFNYTTHHTYTPDFYDATTGRYYETKGVFTSADRSKILTVLEQNPGLDLTLVFQNPRLTLNKNSKTTYGEWATKHNIKWTVLK